MTLVKESPKYIEAEKVSKPKKDGIRVISAMSTPQIVMFLMGRHKVGLLQLSTFGLASFIVYDKVVKLFI